MKNFGLDLEASLLLLPPEAGGRKIPINNGFRAEIRFSRSTRYCSLHFTREFLFPGENEAVIIKMLAHEGDRDVLLTEKEIAVYEGPLRIGEVKDIKVRSEYPVE